MLLQKTDKARAELQPGARSLNLRERSLLLMADGRKTLQDMGAVFGEEGVRTALRLVDAGYLQALETAQPAPLAPAPRPAMAAPTVVQPLIATAVIAHLALPSAPAETNAGRGADAFEGKRSLATTRMFLFDLCERMFARRNPVLAERIREGLRLARDRESMLSESRFMLEEIEKIAGFERADSIAERIAMLLPPEPELVSG